MSGATFFIIDLWIGVIGYALVSTIIGLLVFTILFLSYNIREGL